MKKFKEIERKYLVTGEFRHLATSQTKISQGYLSADPQRTVRIRISNGKGYITVKGQNEGDSISHFEWEKEISDVEANLLLKQCLPGVIEKTRFIIPHGNLKIEVDEFEGENAGLILAEIELKSENQHIELPFWIGQEVTGDKRYYNSYLSQCPFSKWK